jgi:hypothetical protein
MAAAALGPSGRVSEIGRIDAVSTKGFASRRQRNFKMKTGLLRLINQFPQSSPHRILLFPFKSLEQSRGKIE